MGSLFRLTPCLKRLPSSHFCISAPNSSSDDVIGDERRSAVRGVGGFSEPRIPPTPARLGLLLASVCLRGSKAEWKNVKSKAVFYLWAGSGASWLLKQR